MAARFIGSGPALINTAPPVTTYPFTVGIWAYTTDISTPRTFFALANNAVTNQYFYLGSASGAAIQLFVQSGATSQGNNVTTLVVNGWYFILGRFISATNRRLSVLLADGSVGHAQGTTNITPTGINSVGIGATPTSTIQFFHAGQLAEFWWTNTDIQADGTQTQEWLVRQLAWGGPFSSPHIAKDIIEHHSFRLSLGSQPDRGEDSYYGKYGKQKWNNSTTAVTFGRHPPLPYWYAKPPTTRRSVRPAALIGIATATSGRRRSLLLVG